VAAAVGKKGMSWDNVTSSSEEIAVSIVEL